MSLYSRIVRIASTILMICVNTLAVTLPINNVSTKQLSDTLSTLITPIGWTFSIWSVIYCGLILIGVWVFWKQVTVSRHVVRAYIISCICNAAWIVVWHYGYLTAAMLIIVGLLASLIMVDQYLQHQKVDNLTYWMRSIFLIYFGWVQIATLLMTTIYLTYGLGWITTNTLWWPIMVIALTGLANLVVIWRAKRIETSLVGLWALAGIYYGQTNVDIQTACLITGGVLLVAIAFHMSRHSVSKSITTGL